MTGWRDDARAAFLAALSPTESEARADTGSPALRALSAALDAAEAHFRRAPARRPRVRTAECGTMSGYASHYYHGEAPCQPCKDAQYAYIRQWRENRKEAKAT